MVKATEILGEGEFLLEMAEQIVSGLEQPITLHLLKLLGCSASEDVRRHWKHELDTWLLRIAAITLKPDNRPIPQKDLYEWLYEETFGGSEFRYVEMLLRFLVRDYARNDVETKHVADKLQYIYKQLAERLSRNDPGDDIIADL